MRTVLLYLFYFNAIFTFFTDSYAILEWLLSALSVQGGPL